MGEAIKWAAIAVLALFVIQWLHNGINVSAQASPNNYLLPSTGWQNFLSPYYPGANQIVASYGSPSRAFNFGYTF